VEAPAALLLFAAGLAGGVVTAIVGGSSLITFPVLLAVGLPPIIANASNTVATTPGNFAAGLADFGRLPRWDRSFVGLVAVAVAGSITGAALLLLTPERAFTAMVPALIGLATILFGRIRGWLTSSSSAARGAAMPSEALQLLLFAPVAVYGGYFGAGMSVMILAVLSISLTHEFRAINVLKNLLAGLTGAVAIVVFVVQGMVAWAPAMVMMAGGLTGGVLGGRLVRVLPPRLVRGIVLAAGTIFTAVYAWRYWGP
jgi:uncharacterized protein